MPAKQAALPAGMSNAFSFSIFNAMSFFIIQGTPLILYFKSMGVSATMLGIVAALPPCLVILQIPAARYVERIGYRKFVLQGWMMRTWLIAAIAAVVLFESFFNLYWRVSLLLGLLFIYNASRGISLCGILPWYSQLIPEGVRGKFFSREQMFVALSGLGTITGCAWLLNHMQGHRSFSFLFFGSFLAATLSLIFLQRIPDAPVSPSQKNSEVVPWKEIISHRPFQKLLTFNFIINVAFSASSVFWIPFLRDYHAMASGHILALQSLGGIFSAITLMSLGGLIDRTGSRPALFLALALIALHFSVWFCLAARLIPLSMNTILLMQMTIGTGGAFFIISNLRLAIGTIPEMGRTHFFAMLCVVNNLTVGILPVFWGMLIDRLHGYQAMMGPIHVNAYSLMYATLTAAMLIGIWFLRHLTEVRAMRTEEFFYELLVATPSRTLTRILTRRPFQ